MTNVIEALPPEMANLLVDVVGTADQKLLHSLLTENEPSRQEREAIENILADEFARTLDHDSNPNDRGKFINQLIVVFLSQWPIEEIDSGN
jgi:hypothetical protein